LAAGHIRAIIGLKKGRLTLKHTFVLPTEASEGTRVEGGELNCVVQGLEWVIPAVDKSK
jgi:hypothetical protein